MSTIFLFLVYRICRVLFSQTASGLEGCTVTVPPPPHHFYLVFLGIWLHLHHPWWSSWRMFLVFFNMKMNPDVNMCVGGVINELRLPFLLRLFVSAEADLIACNNTCQKLSWLKCRPKSRPGTFWGYVLTRAPDLKEDWRKQTIATAVAEHQRSRPALRPRPPRVRLAE